MDSSPSNLRTSTPALLHHFDQAVEIALVGALVAFVALGVIATLIGLISFIDRRQTSKPAPAAATTRPGGQPAGAGIDDLTLVLISSAAATILQGRGRVRHVRRVGQMTGHWAMKGRVTVQGSHVLAGRFRSRGAR